MTYDLEWSQGLSLTSKEVLHYYAFSSDPDIARVVNSAEAQLAAQEAQYEDQIEKLRRRYEDLDIAYNELREEYRKSRSQREAEQDHTIFRLEGRIEDLNYERESKERELNQYRERFKVWNILKSGVDDNRAIDL